MLEHKLAEHFYRSNSSEVHLWVSIHTVAKRCNFEFSDFIKICCPSEISLLLKKLGPVDAQISRLVHPDPESSVSYKVQASAKNSIILARQKPSYALSDMAPYEPGSYLKCSNSKVQTSVALAIGLEHSIPHNPSQAAATTNTSFQAHSCSSLALSNFPTSSSLSNSTSKRFNLDNCKIQDGTMAILGPCVPRLKNDNGTYLMGSLNGIEPYPHLKEHPRAIRVPCKKRVQRQKRLPMNYDQLIPKLLSAEPCSTMQALWPSNTTTCGPDLCKENCDNNAKQINLETDLQFLLQKELKPSDVGNLGRIVLPKRQAEKNLPHLETKEGLTLPFEDMQTSQIWNLRFRFWPNNKTRMYLLECTGQFVKFHRLEEGDIITLYKSPSTGKYMINGKKVASTTPPAAAKSLNRNEQQANCLSSNSACSLQLALAAGNMWPSFDITNALNEKGTILIHDNENGGDSLQCTTTPLAIRTTESTFMNDLNETEDLIQELSRFEADSRPIDEIIVFNKM